jgi:hypothetical protein
VQYTAVQYTAVEYTAVQYTAVQYTAVQYTAVQYTAVQYTAVQYTAVQYTAVQYKIDGIATCCRMDGLTIESQWGRDFPHPSRHALWTTQPPIQKVSGLSQW